MADIEPRYEFRVWGETLVELKEKLERRAAPVKAVSSETYLISRATERCNAKIRAGLIDIKILLAEHRGLEQWKPILKAAFPLDRTVIATQIFPRLDIRPPHLSRARYEKDEFLNEVIGPEPEIVIVELSKVRFRFSLLTCMAEFTVVRFNDMTRETVAVESADPDELLRLIHEIGLDRAENVSYVRYIKRMLGIGKNP
jgi:exopolyphosphatase / guanosine-5'-triphosphate,3'-diphosphate pyrophosphatase